MGWSNENYENDIKKEKKSSKVLVKMIIALVILITLLAGALLIINLTQFSLSVDGKLKENYNKSNLITLIDEKKYINIENFSKLVGYEYHEGEYKSFTIEEDKCYIQGKEETTSFYLNENKIYKLPINEISSDYNEIEITNPIKKINGKMYATIDAIELAFNVAVDHKENELNVYTLDYLIKIYNKKVKNWGYADITQQEFENKKTLLYGYLIVKKENGLYKIINDDNTKELVSDKYTSIEFYESAQEFFVTNSLGEVGIIKLDGTTKIEPIYDSISVLDKKEGLYIVQKNEKYGIIKSGDIIVVDPEYDDIGINVTNKSSNPEKEESVIVEEKQYIILDDLIPVYKDKKWGAFDKTGKEVIKVDYDGFGCAITTIEINGVSKEVKPVFDIEKCNGIVVKKSNKYGIIDKNGKELVQLQVDSIYEILNPENENERYYMVYNNKEYNVIEKLIEAGVLNDETTNNTHSTNSVNNIETNLITTDLNNNLNTMSSNIIQ